MKRLTSWLAAGVCTALLGFALAPKANAQGTVEQSSFTLTEPLDVGGTVLQPGDYQIEVVLLQGNRSMLRVMNADGTQLITTVLSIPHQEGPGTEKIPASRYTFDPASAGHIMALRTWYAPDTPGLGGLSLLDWALATTLTSRAYQARQERAFSSPETRRDLAPSADANPHVLARIEIPRIGVRATVRDGDDDTTLAIAAGHIPGTAQPGERENMALAGHRNSFFRALRGIKCQDTIRVVTLKRFCEYVADSTEIVGPEDTKVLDPTSDAALPLAAGGG